MFALVLLAVVLVAASAQPDCPNPVTDCETDPCEGATCPRFLTADCQANLCHGLCTANFLWRGRNVTDRCSVRMCDEIECPGKRVCVEEVTPSSCPEGRPRCRQFINVRCALPRPITDCNLLECPEGMVCRDRIRGEGVVCAIPRNCRQIECSEGLECVVLNRRAQCVTIPTTPAPPVTVTPNVTDEPTTASGMAPESCDELECPRGQGCVVQDGTPTCSPFQPSCETLDCTENSECSSVIFPSQDLSVSACIDQETADAIRAFAPCSEQNFCDPNTELCLESRNMNGSFIRSFCISTGCSNDTQCAADESCLTVPPSVGVLVGSVCIPTDGDFEFGQDCSTSGRVCDDSLCSNIQFEGSTVGTICDMVEIPLLAQSCDALDCASQLPGSDCVLQTLESGPQFAQCLPESQVDFLVSFFRAALGLPPITTPPVTSTNPPVSSTTPPVTSTISPPITTPPVTSTISPPITIPPVTSSGLAPESCDELECPRGQGCIVQNGIPTCSQFQPSCETLDCSEVGDCVSAIIPSQDLSLSACDELGTADNIRALLPCSDQNFCESDAELCVDSRRVNGTFVRSSCISSGCGNDTQCVADELCLTVPPSAGVPVASVCVPTGGDFEFGQDCSTSGRVCPTGSVCNDIQLEGETFVTICSGIIGEIPQFARTCDELDCESQFPGGDCVLQTTESGPQVAGCFPEGTINGLVSNFRAILGLSDPLPPITTPPDTSTISPPITIPPVTSSGMTPDSCDKLECPRGQGCLVFDETPTCSQLQPTCETLDCLEIGDCISVVIPSEDLSLSACFDRRDVDAIRAFVPCSEQNFCDPDAELCVDSRLVNATFIRSFCISTGCSNDTQCAADESCLAVPPSGGVPVASVCVPTDGDFEFGQDCSTSGRVCDDSLCSNIRFEGSTVGTICTNDVSDIPFARTCDALDCESRFRGGDCLLQTAESGPQFAQCLQEDLLNDLISTIRAALGLPPLPPITTTPVTSTTPAVTSSGMAPDSCDNFECPGSQGCLIRSDGAPFCSPFQPSCATLDCTGGGDCSSLVIPSQDLSVSLCIDREAVDDIKTLLPCSDFCRPNIELCLESRLVNSTFVRSFCIPTGCSNDTQCAADESCLSLPVASVCVPTNVAFEFGSDCTTSGRECSGFTVCSNIHFEGLTVGTICDMVEIPRFAESCSALDCASQLPDGSDCVLQTLENGPQIARCFPESEIDLFVSIYRAVLGLPPITTSPAVTSSGMAPDRCANFECPRGQGCLIRQDGTLICSIFQLSCETLDCSEIGECASVSLPNQNLSASVCVDPDTIEFVRARVPCIEQNYCDPDTEICVDSRRVDGNFARSFCLSGSCESDTQCAADESCLAVPFAGLSLCVPTDQAFEVGPDCTTSGRECPTSPANDLICNNIQFNGETVGTICAVDIGVRQPYSPTCDGLDCKALFPPGGDCVLESTENGPRFAECEPQFGVDITVQGIRDALELA